jgi:hypothetical protein
MYIIYVINKELIPENMDKKEFVQYFKKVIEQKIKELLKPDEQLKKEAEEKAKIELQKTIDRIGYRIRDIEMYLQKKLTSNRENPTKKEYKELKEQLLKLTA